MLGRAVAWSLGVHALAVVGLAWSLAIPTAWPAALAVVTDDARARGDVRDAVERGPDSATAIELRAPGDAITAAARSSGHGAGAPTLVTGRTDEATVRAQPYDAPHGYAMQRIATGTRRESREQVRATPHPAPTPWLASKRGEGHARVEARRSVDADADKATSGAAGFARPDVQKNPAATDAAEPADEVADRVDQPLVSDEKQPQRIELTRPTSPGAATSGRGDGALGYSPVGHGRAPGPPVATYQSVYDRYLEGVREKVDPLWEFPRELAVRMEQGDVLVAFTIRKNGSVSDVRVLKGSGFDKFDKNVVAAIRKAAPFGPLPETLGAELKVTAPFEGSNPAIR